MLQPVSPVEAPETRHKALLLHMPPSLQLQRGAKLLTNFDVRRHCASTISCTYWHKFGSNIYLNHVYQKNRNFVFGIGKAIQESGRPVDRRFPHCPLPLMQTYVCSHCVRVIEWNLNARSGPELNGSCWQNGCLVTM